MGKIADWLSQNKANAQQYVAKNGDPTGNGMFSWKAIKGLWNDVTGNTQIDKQLSAQANENALTREYNLQLAKQQNKWNIEQWNRENAYNSPAAQKARLVAAGLNPDMMYGQGGISNTAVSSPEMTAGAPGTPMDWTSLGSKKSVLQTAAEMANIDNIKAVTDKIRSETEGIDIDNKYKDVKNALGIEIDKQLLKNYGKEFEKLDSTIKQIQSQTANMDVDTVNKIIDGIMRSRQMDHLVREAKAKADISESDARVAFETELQRVAIVGHQSVEAKANADFAKFKEQSAWVPLAIDAAQLGINIFEVALKFKNLKDFFKSRPDLFPDTPPPAGK